MKHQLDYQILKGNLGVILSETDGKLEVQFAGIDTIHTEKDLRTFQSILDDAILNFTSSNLNNFDECVDMSSYEDISDCECHNGPRYCH